MPDEQNLNQDSNNLDDQNTQNQDAQNDQENTADKEVNQNKEVPSLGSKKTENNSEQKNNDVDDLFTAPENYDYKDVKLPDNMKLDVDLINKFNPLAKKLNLSQKGANEIMSLAVELIDKRSKDFQKFVEHTQKAKIAEYEDLLINDKEIGGNKLNDVLKTANIVYDKFVSDDVKKIFEQTGLNKHPSIIKMFLQFGKFCQEDKISISNNPPHVRTAEDWYPNMK